MAVSAGIPFAACSNDDASTAAIVTGPPELTIERIVSAGGAVVSSPTDGACVARGKDAARSLVVVLGKTDGLGQLVNWTFAAPFGCQGAAQCGYVRVTVDTGAGGVQVDSVSPTATLSLASLGDVTGSATITAQLLSDDGTVAVDAEGKAFATAQVRVDLQESCGNEPVPPDGGSPSSPDAGTPDTGAPSPVPDGGVTPVPEASTPDATPPVPVPDAAPPIPDAAPPVPDGAPPVTVPDATPQG